MPELEVTRAHLKAACYEQNWDLLDKLLETDPRLINDNALFSDGWGEWWGLLMDCAMRGRVDGVRVLLSHGANPNLPTWGEGLPPTPLAAAKDKPAILSLLLGETPAHYVRRTDPPLPLAEPPRPKLEGLDREVQVRELAGVAFPLEGDWI